MRTTPKTKAIKFLGGAIAFISLAVVLGFYPGGKGQERVQASSNLIKGGSFEDNLEKYWVNWKESNNSRTYEFFRSYEVSSFGNGSYSAAVTAHGEPRDKIAGLISNSKDNSFQVKAGNNYYLRFYAKATQEMNFFAYLENKEDYTPVTDWQARSVSTEWQKYLVELSPTSTTSALFMLSYKNMPDGATLYLDGVNLFRKNIRLKTNKVEGYIGDQRNLDLINLEFFDRQNIKIELPYYNGEEGEISTKKITPKEKHDSRVVFDMPEGSFTGAGRVYVSGEMVGEFQYNVKPKIKEISPVLLRGDNNLTIYGSGFIPKHKNTFLVLKVIGPDGHKHKKWLDYSFIDSDLSNITVKVPANIAQGNCRIVTSFTNREGKSVKNRSNSVGYKVKPRISKAEWSKKGYEQVGDKIKIYGNGIADSPSVYFYNSEGEQVGKKGAKVLSAKEKQVVIESETPHDLNKLNVIVGAGGSKSNKKEALSYIAKPELDHISAPKSRRIDPNSPKIPAAKAGQSITFIGQGFNAGTDFVAVEFQGLDTTITTSITSSQIKRGGSRIVVPVPSGVQNGYTTVIVNGKKSNYLALEIIPSIVEVSPGNIKAGEDIIIKATGVGDNTRLTEVSFSLGNNEEIVKHPYKIKREGPYALIYVKAPVNLAHSRSAISIQYNRWSSDEKFDLHVSPHITRAAINMDNKVLTIKGYGFSLNLRDNKITYKYVDENKTVIDPKVKKLGVYSTEEGQELRIKINDDYHYGYVSAQVGEEKSNEVNFGPVQIRRLARRVEYVKSENKIMGVLYISGYNFGKDGGVKVGDHWADVHYRSEFFIIAVVEKQYIHDNPVVIAKK